MSYSAAPGLAPWEPDEDDRPQRAPPEVYADLFEGESPREARLPIVSRLLAAMKRRRPDDAPDIVDRWGDGALEAEQLAAFTARARA